MECIVIVEKYRGKPSVLLAYDFAKLLLFKFVIKLIGSSNKQFTNLIDHALRFEITSAI